MISPARVQATVSVLETVAQTPEAIRRKNVGGEATLAVWLREIEYDLHRLPHDAPDVRFRRRDEILVQLSAAIAHAGMQAARLRPVLAEIAGWDL